MKKNLFTPSCVLIICFVAGSMHVSAQHDFNFKKPHDFRESKTLFEKDNANDRLHRNAYLTPSHPFKDNYRNASVNTLIQLLDSVYFWSWDTITAAWEPDAYGKDINMAYDANNNLLGFDNQTWNGSAWINNSRYSYTYDLNNNRTGSLFQTWNGSSWDNNYQYTYAYDINNNLVSYLSQSWNGSSWVNQNQTFFTYDANNNNLSRLSQVWNGSSWDNSMQYLFSYDANNNRVHTLIQGWSGSWTNGTQDTLTYNANNRIIYELGQSWNGSSWVNAYEDFYNYDVNNNLTNWLYMWWDGTAWLNSERDTLTYDVNNNPVTELAEVWVGMAWVNAYIWTDTYDANNFIVSDAFKEYNSIGTTVDYGDSAVYYFHTGVTGIAGVAANDEMLTVYPNPVAGELSVSGSMLPGLSALKIFDVKGQEVYRKSFPNGNAYTHASIDVSKLQAGIYFAELICGEKVYRRKIMKDG